MSLPSSGLIHLQVADTTQAFHALAPHWNALLRSSTRPSVFLTFEYLSTWWDVYSGSCKLRILSAWKEGKLVGLAPFAIGFGRSPSRRLLRHLSFLGFHGSELPEFLDFIVAPGCEEALIPLFLQTATEEWRREWDVLYLNLVPSDSPKLNLLLSQSESGGFPGRILDSLPTPYLPLPGSWEELLRDKSKNSRKQFHNHWNRLHKQHRVEILRAGEDVDLDQAFEVLLSLNSRRWGAEGAAFTTCRTRLFHRKLAHRFHSLGWLCFLLMKVDGVFAAARFDYVFDGKLWNIQGGWNPDLAQLSPGRMLLAVQMQWCIAQGLREYDFLAGEASYKRSWATAERRLVNVEWLRLDSARTQAFLALRSLKNWLTPLQAAASAPLPAKPL